MKNIERRLKIFKFQKWILNGVIIACIVTTIFFFWPIALIGGSIIIGTTKTVLTLAVLFETYKYFSNKNKP